jgi:flagellar basal body-associated protein FliL
MNIKKQLNVAWAIIVVLAFLLIVALFFLANPRGQQDTNITAQRDLVREYCTKTDQESKDKCAQELQDLSDMLRTFSTDLTKDATVKGSL